MRLIIGIVLVSLVFSCSAAHIAERGEYIDERSIQVGASRASLLARFGAPIDTVVQNGLIIDIFRVRQGETTGGKILKGTGTTLLAIGTLGISEIVAAPVTEETEYITFKVEYDAENRVRTVEFLK